MGESKIIAFSLQTLFELGIQWIALLIIIAVMAKFLYKPVLDFIEKRRQFIKDQIDEAEKRKSSATTMQGEYEGKLKHIQKEADNILSSARQQAIKKEEDIINQAKIEAEEIKKRALEAIALEEARVRDEIKNEMIEVATLMANKFVKVSIDEKEQKTLINNTIKEMGDVQWLS